jgi:ABA4-like protein
VITTFGSNEGGFGSLDQVAILFSNRQALLAGWIHYLAFDLFIGSWEVRDAQRLAIPHLAVIPALVLTFMFGPIGLLLYLLERAFWKKTIAIDASAGATVR